MKKIAVLIDFSEGSINALKQALKLSVLTNSDIWLINMVDQKNKKEEVERKLAIIAENYAGHGQQIRFVVGCGSLYHETNNLLINIEPDVVLICTHGIKGFKQHIFGSNILKLTQTISFPCIVFQDGFINESSNFKTILFPIGSNPGFEVKIRQTTTIAKTLNSAIIIYIINRPGIFDDNTFKNNFANSKKFFEDNGVNYNVIKEEVNTNSYGYSRQTIEYAKLNNISLISLVAKVSENAAAFGYVDKENFLVNESGIAILTCNE